MAASAFAPTLILCLILAVVSGCGRRTAPRPLESLLPPVSAVQARQRGDRVLLAWRLPDAGDAAPRGGVRGFVVWIESFPFACGAEILQCRASAEEMIEISRDQGGIVEEGRRGYFLYAPRERRDTWLFRVAARYRDGTSLRVKSPLVRGLNAIPDHEFAWEWVPEESSEEGAAAPRAVRLYWQPRREALVQIVRAGVPPVERERFYRVNLYRRRAGESWPMVALNKEPLAAGSWIDTLPLAMELKAISDIEPMTGSDMESQTQGGVEYTLRLVDRFGGEGPAAPARTVSIALGDIP